MTTEATNLITNLETLWARAAGEPVTVEIHGDRVYGFAGELGCLRIANEWAHPARNRFASTDCFRGRGWAYSMDHLIRGEAA